MKQHLLPALAGLMAAIACGGCAAGRSVSPRIADNWAASWKVRTGNGHGSGVVLTEDGYILTAGHVADSEKLLGISVQDDNGAWTDVPVELVALDRDKQLALLKAERHFSRVAVLGRLAECLPGDLVYVIGYAYDLEATVGRGYILRRQFDFTTPGRTVRGAMILDMFSGPGQSGGGIYAERDGRLIGLVVGNYPLTYPGLKTYPARWATHVDDIRSFLDQYGIAYRTE